MTLPSYLTVHRYPSESTACSLCGRVELPCMTILKAPTDSQARIPKHKILRKEASLGLPNESPCAHPNCTCATAPQNKDCSPYCETAKGSSSIACECGHPGCARANSDVRTRSAQVCPWGFRRQHVLAPRRYSLKELTPQSSHRGLRSPAAMHRQTLPPVASFPLSRHPRFPDAI